MRLAAVQAADGRETNALVSALARAAQARGVAVAGVIQPAPPAPGAHRCDMDLLVLPEGPALRIAQPLGPGARGCRLDPGAIETAVGLCAARIEAGAELLVVNKFGKHEAEGRGFRPLIAEALARGLPVLVGVNALNSDAFSAFSAGLADWLAPRPEALEAWLARQIG